MSAKVLQVHQETRGKGGQHLKIVSWNSLHALINAGEWLGNSIEWFFFLKTKAKENLAANEMKRIKTTLLCTTAARSVCR